MMERILMLLLGGLALSWILGLLASLHPLLEIVTLVRAQLVFVALVPVAGFLLLQNWRLATGAVVVLLLLASAMVPIWTASPDPLRPDGETVRVMQYNIYFGNDDYQAIADHIIQSDVHVVAVHELLPVQWGALEPLITPAFPHRIAEPLPETDGQPGGGMALLSRTPLTRIELPAEVSPIDRVVLAATTQMSGAEVTVIGLHPHASRTDGAKVALRQQQLDGVAALVDATDGPAVIMTDLNITPTSPIYRAFLDDLGWRDPHHIVGWQSSWPSWGGSFGLPIDHVFVSDHFALHGYDVGSGAGSDHKSVTATLSLPPPNNL